MAVGASDQDGRFFHIWIADDRVFIHNQADVLGAGPLWMATDDGLHDYRFVVDGATGRLFVDGSTSPSLSLPLGPIGESSATNRISFGDGTGWLGGEAEFTTVTCSNVPEPATMGMLALGGLAILRRRRR